MKMLNAFWAILTIGLTPGFQLGECYQPRFGIWHEKEPGVFEARQFSPNQRTLAVIRAPKGTIDLEYRGTERRSEVLFDSWKACKK